MGCEFELRQMMEANGYRSKPKTKGGSVWTYEHPEHDYTTTNYHNNGTISFNYLGKYMTDAAETAHGPLFGMKPTEKEQFYREALSAVPFYGKISNYLQFSIRAAKGIDYVRISDNVGIEVLSEVLQFIISDYGNMNKSTYKTNERSKTGNDLPQKQDVAEAYRQLAQKKVSTNVLLDKTKELVIKKGYVLRPDWREKTRVKIKEWSQNGNITKTRRRVVGSKQQSSASYDISNLSDKAQCELFWREFLDIDATTSINLFRQKKPRTKERMSFNSKLSNRIKFVVSLNLKKVGTSFDLVIEEKSAEENGKIFNSLKKYSAEIEERVGAKLLWDGPKERRIRCMISLRSDITVVFNNKTAWPVQQKNLIEKMARFYAAFQGLGILD